MILEVLTTLTVIAGIFGTVAAFSKDARFLLGMGAILILTGGMLLSSPSVDVNVGDSITVENSTLTNTSTGSEIDTTKNKTTEFRNIDNNHTFQVSRMLALIYLAIGIYCMFVGGFTPRRFTIKQMRKQNR